jgi:hypothetical protein
VFVTASLDLDSVFAAAIELPGHRDRHSYIVRACGKDNALRRRVEQLVAAHFEAGDFLEDSGPALANLVGPSASHPRKENSE